MAPIRRRPKYGAHTELTSVMLVLAGGLPLPEQIERLHEIYPWLTDSGISRMAYNADRALARNDTAAAERIAHDFIHTALAAKPEPPSTVPVGRLRRWWLWLRWEWWLS